MDEVLNKFQTALNCEDSHKSLYKNWGKGCTQEERRKEILTNQKGQRNKNLDNFRGIFLEYINGVEKCNIFDTEAVSYRPNIYVAGFNKTSRSYNNVLMLSEWLIDRPIDFEQNWYVVPCPKGVRTLVVSHNKTTKFFTKNGRFMMECKTGLPGGNQYNTNKRKGSFCVLDGFYLEKNNTLYILDLLAWNWQPMTDGETEFRQFWLKANMQELTDVSEISKTNKVVFKILPMVDCSRASFNNFMMKYPHFENNFPILDGLLFYHKHAHYVAGETPLVGWLYPFMVQEVLGYDIPVHSMYEDERPNDYITQSYFIEKFVANNFKKNMISSSTNMEEEEEESIGLEPV
ncbi:unnamed protein product, partial [Iphiclides podalirius]